MEEKATAPKWVATGRKTTLGDGGKKRAVYRNSETGESAIKRMVKRNGGGTSARYVKVG